MKRLFILLLFYPLLLIAQNDTVTAQETLHQNNMLVAQFAQLAPMSINPYLTVFLTSLCSKLGFSNDFVSINPFFNNWFVLILFGVLFLFTALVGTVFKTNKATAAIGNVDTFLSNKAALIINAFVMLSPAFMSDIPGGDQVVYHAGFISVSFKTLLILVVSMYFLVVVMTVRFFVDILIFLSPIPLIDSILEVVKIAFTAVLVAITIISPTAAVVIAGLMFVVALIFYRRSVRLVNKTKYLVVYPILNLFRKKDKVLMEGNTLSILVLVAKKTKNMGRGKIVQLQMQNGRCMLIKRRFLLSNVEEEISLADCFLSQNHLDIHLKNESGTVSVVLNRSYHKYLDELSTALNVPVRDKSTTKNESGKGFVNKVKGMFSTADKVEFEAVGE